MDWDGWEMLKKRLARNCMNMIKFRVIRDWGIYFYLTTRWTFSKVNNQAALRHFQAVFRDLYKQSCSWDTGHVYNWDRWIAAERSRKQTQQKKIITLKIFWLTCFTAVLPSDIFTKTGSLFLRFSAVSLSFI